MNPLLVGFASGIAGWIGENVICSKPRYSQVFGGARIPFLPVYAIGGAIVTAVAPEITDMPLLARGVVYAGLLSGVEMVAGYADRVTGHRSWDYDGKTSDLGHAALWGAIGLGLEELLR